MKQNVIMNVFSCACTCIIEYVHVCAVEMERPLPDILAYLTLKSCLLLIIET